MKIDRNTKYEDFILYEPLLEDGQADRIEKAAVRLRFGEDGFWSMTLGELFDVLSGDVKRLTWGVAPDSVFGVYLVRAFRTFMGDGTGNGFIATLKALTPPPTADAMRASQGCLEQAFDESVYVFCRQYFNLHGFAEVERLKLADLLLAKRDTYNQVIVDRNMAAAIRKGAKA